MVIDLTKMIGEMHRQVKEHGHASIQSMPAANMRDNELRQGKRRDMTGPLLQTIIYRPAVRDSGFVIGKVIVNLK